MHIPDGFINIGVAGVTYGASAIANVVAVKKTNKVLREKHIPMLGVTAAFIFAAQMLNFPIIGGTSGHLLGAALVSILLGPWAGVLVMSAILLVQSLVFQDGGLVALGANIFNMGIIGCFSSYYIYRLIMFLMKSRLRSYQVAAFVAAWVSVLLAATAASIELAVSGTVPLTVALPSMAGFHALIGVGEGLITTAVVSLILATRKDLLQMEKV